MILECHRALTGMPPFVVVMEEGRYGLWKLCADDDDSMLGRSLECLAKTLAIVVVRFFTVQMPVMSPNQQFQGTEEIT